VLRGGSFDNQASNVRCANRNRNAPADRNNNVVGVRKDSLLVRLGPGQGGEALTEAHVSEFEITGPGTVKGWVVVGLEGVQSDDQLKGWVQRTVKFVGKLPDKEM
jgi:hypothetical protein